MKKYTVIILVLVMLSLIGCAKKQVSQEQEQQQGLELEQQQPSVDTELPKEEKAVELKSVDVSIPGIEFKVPSHLSLSVREVDKLVFAYTKTIEDSENIYDVDSYDVENLEIEKINKPLSDVTLDDMPSDTNFKYSEKFDTWINSGYLDWLNNPPDEEAYDCAEKLLNKNKTSFNFIERAIAGPLGCESILEIIEQSVDKYITKNNLKSFISFGGDGGGVYETVLIESPDKKSVVKILYLRFEAYGDDVIGNRNTTYAIMDSVKFTQ